MTDNSPDDQKAPEPEPFTRTLHAIRGGALHAELTDELAALTEAVMETGKAGTLTLQIKVAKASKAGGHQMLVTDLVTSKPPRPDRGESFFFYDAESGGITRHDPLQPELPLREVPRPNHHHQNLKEA